VGANGVKNLLFNELPFQAKYYLVIPSHVVVVVKIF
jgi:hypothetical protein